MASDITNQLRQLAGERDISQNVINKMILTALADIYDEVNAIRERENRFADELRDLRRETQEYRSILWLLRYRTRDTVAVLLFIFIVLSLWFVSDFRQALFTLAGLPPHIIP